MWVRYPNKSLQEHWNGVAAKNLHQGLPIHQARLILMAIDNEFKTQLPCNEAIVQAVRNVLPLNAKPVQEASCSYN